METNDIESIQYFVSKSLSTGAIGRDLMSFIMRFSQTSWINESNLDVESPDFHKHYRPYDLETWANWLTQDFEDPEDPYYELKDFSELLCKQFCHLNEVYLGNAKTWLDRIKFSKKSISYQLDRIYLHRNQIVHSGKFLSEYSNLWAHLEWYVGKLLTYCVFRYLSEKKIDKTEIFMDLESDHDQLVATLKNKRDEEIKELEFAYKLIFKHTWLFF